MRDANFARIACGFFVGENTKNLFFREIISHFHALFYWRVSHSLSNRVEKHSTSLFFSSYLATMRCNKNMSQKIFLEIPENQD